MAKPTNKSPLINELLDSIAPFGRTHAIESDICSFCGNPAIEFRDDLSRKEYTISGFCQNCQDKTFGV